MVEFPPNQESAGLRKSSGKARFSGEKRRIATYLMSFWQNAGKK
jgi:hypothetical protein